MHGQKNIKLLLQNLGRNNFILVKGELWSVLFPFRG